MNNNISKIIVFILITGIMFQGYSIKTYAEERTEIKYNTADKCNQFSFCQSVLAEKGWMSNAT